jgi:hypothetical protein
MRWSWMRPAATVFFIAVSALGVRALPERPLGGAGVAFVAYADRGHVASCVVAVVTARDLALEEGADARAFIVGIATRWTIEEKRLAYLQGVNVLAVEPQDAVLARIQQVSKWPVQRFFWLLVPKLLDQRWGIRYAVILDCDELAKDAHILQQLPRLVGIGVVRSSGMIVMNLEELTKLRWADWCIRTLLDQQHTKLPNLLNICLERPI